jgi:hypothetical protein
VNEIPQDSKYRAPSKQASERIKCRYNHGSPGMYINQNRKGSEDFGTGKMELHWHDYNQSVVDCVL